MRDFEIGGYNAPKREDLIAYNESQSHALETHIRLLDLMRRVNKSRERDSLVAIRIEHNYRAKNGFGAMDIGKIVFQYNPHTDSLFIIESK